MWIQWKSRNQFSHALSPKVVRFSSSKDQKEICFNLVQNSKTVNKGLEKVIYNSANGQDVVQCYEIVSHVFIRAVLKRRICTYMFVDVSFCLCMAVSQIQCVRLSLSLSLSLSHTHTHTRAHYHCESLCINVWVCFFFLSVSHSLSLSLSIYLF